MPKTEKEAPTTSTSVTTASSRQASVDLVKLPSPLASAATHASRPASKSNSFKQVMGKGGFLSFLLCCTAGASSFDHRHKHTAVASRKPNRQSHASSATDGAASRITEKNSNTPFTSKEKDHTVALPTIVTDQTELSHLHSNDVREADTSGGSTPSTPDSGLLYSPQVWHTPRFLLKLTQRAHSDLLYPYCRHSLRKTKVGNAWYLIWTRP